MRVLITGATGFLGRELVQRFIGEGHAVRGLGRQAAACEELRASGVEVVRGDLRDDACLRQACAGIECVVHAGAQSSPWGAQRLFRAHNVDATRTLIAACRAQGVRRLVYISSPSVTFTGRDQRHIDESAPLASRFLCHYSWSKAEAERLVRAAHAAALETVILRPKALFGPRDTSLLPRLVRAARAGRLYQFGDGRNQVDLTYIDNAVEAIRLALSAPHAAGQTYFITNDEHPHIWDLLRTILRELKIDCELRPMPLSRALRIARVLELWGGLTGREPALTRYTVSILARNQTYNIAAARRDLGYVPRVSLAQGIEATLAAWRASEAT